MFNSLRTNSPIYIFHKSQTPKLEIGYVLLVIGPKPKYVMPPNMAQTLEMVMDLLVKVGDLILSYQQLPAHTEIADTFSNGISIVISDNRSAINSEVLNFKQKSVDAIDSIDTHKSIIELCDKIISDLNPEFAEKQQQLELINDLKGQMDIMSKNMKELMEANRRLIEQFLKGEATI